MRTWHRRTVANRLASLLAGVLAVSVLAIPGAARGAAWVGSAAITDGERGTREHFKTTTSTALLLRRMLPGRARYGA
jgi:hypothetical protein